ncbi:MAG: nucleotidyltransferase domain-containing protein [Nanoarchaeota archaeon]
MNIKKTMCHHTLKGVVCDRHLFFGCSRTPRLKSRGFYVRDINKLLNSLEFELSNEKKKEIESQTNNVVSEIESQIKKYKLSAEVFIGGSFAKGTLAKRNKYDVDIFVRFDRKYESPDEILKNVLERVSSKIGLILKTIHGSRDYFALISGDLIFEIVPVKKISKPEQAVNSTDLSYFHVKYVKNKIKAKPALVKEILLAKAFCRAQRVYGAESWVHGFSGYALECLVINYGSFLKMLKELCKSKGQILIDSEKKYKKKHEMIIELNESKRKGPIILIDPTYKQRNVCSALNQETFDRFSVIAKKFIKRPNRSFFEREGIVSQKIESDARKKGFGYLKLIIRSEKQEGDIAGAKLEKFYKFLLQEINKFYSIKLNFFEFDEKNEAEVYLVVKPNKKLLQIGPMLKMKTHAESFKKVHKNVFVKRNRLYAPIEVKEIKVFIEEWKNKKASQIKEMDISTVNIV